MKWINDDMTYGYDYDWNMIRKEFAKLKIPKGCYNPCVTPFEQVKWAIDLSIRSTGKTTNWLLIAMLLNKFYPKFRFGYVRQTEDMTAPKLLGSLFDVIIRCGYVEKITEGKYNTIQYKARKWYYAYLDDDGNTVEKSEEPIGYALSLDKTADYKSSLNAMIDLVILDEFIGPRYYNEEFLYFCDLLSTCFRARLSPFVVLLANNINKYSTWFSELNIQNEINKLSVGENRIIETNLGTKLYLEFIGNKTPKRRKIFTSTFFGFNNPKLASITGTNDWAIANYPHIRQDETRKQVFGSAAIEYNGNVIQIEICTSADLGVHVLVHKRTTPLKHPERIYTLNEIEDSIHTYRTGNDKFDKMLFGLRADNKWYYSTNEVGDIINSFLKECRN